MLWAQAYNPLVALHDLGARPGAFDADWFPNDGFGH